METLVTAWSEDSLKFLMLLVLNILLLGLKTFRVIPDLEIVKLTYTTPSPPLQLFFEA